MAKPNPLALGLKKIEAPKSAPPLAATPQPHQGAGRAPSRRGQVLIGGFFAPEVHKQLKMIAVERETTQQALLAEALNVIFAKSGKPEIATLGRLFESAEA